MKPTMENHRRGPGTLAAHGTTLNIQRKQASPTQSSTVDDADLLQCAIATIANGDTDSTDELCLLLDALTADGGNDAQLSDGHAVDAECQKCNRKLRPSTEI